MTIFFNRPFNASYNGMWTSEQVGKFFDKILAFVRVKGKDNEPYEPIPLTFKPKENYYVTITEESTINLYNREIVGLDFDGEDYMLLEDCDGYMLKLLYDAICAKEAIEKRGKK